MFLHLDLDSFFVAVERRRQPDLAGRPVVIGGHPGSRGMVAAASREARRCGIRAGMPLAQAAIRCPDGIFLDGAFDACFSASLQIDELLRRETPEVEWLSIDEAFIGLPASARPRAAVDAAERLHRDIGALGFDASCGIARSKLVAKIASSLARPSGVIHVLDGYEARFLSPLKIDMLPGITPALVMRLRGAGIRRLGQLAKLTDAQVSLIAGRAGRTLAQQAAGIDGSRIHRTTLPPPRLNEEPVDPPTADRSVLDAALRRECERAGRELRSRGVFAGTLALRIRFADGRLASRTVRLPEPAAADDALAEAAGALLASMTSRERPVRAVAVSCAGLLSAGASPALFPLRRQQNR
ncbi:MAG TPA: DNA polymerase IV [Vicinamibacterales bacterium]|nr:DNA polymerase IV [Vicinamibacterales bacterium]